MTKFKRTYVLLLTGDSSFFDLIGLGENYLFLYRKKKVSDPTNSSFIVY